jgi:methylglutaconyl-CoA hydratase
LTRSTRCERKGRAAWITLDAPAKRNALSAEMTRELAEHLAVALDDPAVRALVITGTGRSFCAGADLTPSDAGGSQDGQDPFAEILQRIWLGPKPVVAAINGHAFGGGLGLVAAADIAIASDDALFGFSEVRIGVIPAIVSVFVLPKLGPHHAMRLFLTGERFDAGQAVAYGLVHRAVPPDALEATVASELDSLFQGGPIAIAEAKQLVRKIPTLAFPEALAFASQKSRELFQSEEAARGIRAFAQKRKPEWVE